MNMTWAMQKRAFLKKFIDKFIADDTTTLAASLAFYTALSLAPLMILFVTISSALSVDLRLAFLSEMRHLIGEDASAAVALVMERVAIQKPHLTSFAGTAGVVTILISASLIFGQLRNTLNRIFFTGAKNLTPVGYVHGVFRFLKARTLHIALAFFSVLVLISSIYVSVFVYSNLQSDSALFREALSFVVSFVFYVVLFSLLFRFIPDRRLTWRQTFSGAALTAVLFAIGKEVIGLYLSKSAIGTSYGNAGSVIVLLVWVYYSALITLVGAQVISILRSPKNS